MHENNINRNPHAPTRRAKITLSFDVPEAEATEDWMSTVIGSIKRDVIKDLGTSAEVTGKWL